MTTSETGSLDQENQAKVFAEREGDWRNGNIIYQVLIDRFAPSERLDTKRGLYPSPKVLKDWSQTPSRGTYLPEARLNSQELEFWGGDFDSLRSHLDYIEQLGIDVLYLNPIHLAYTNHKYDALDFQKISPEFGDRQDFIRLAAEVHARGMRVVLDGVFNHMGRNAAIFQDALANPDSPWRDWFAIGPQYAGGARVWTGFQNLPELNIENPAVRGYLYQNPDSVVRSYLREGADGWRLDTAFELGYQFLGELTQAAHEEKPGSLIVGEIVNYPDEWLRSIDAVMNFTLRQIVLGAIRESISPAAAGRMLNRLVCDAGIEAMLKSWMVIDNHDIPRIASLLPEIAQRRLAQTLQFTLPGAPNIYYGSELGMTGGGDPENRGPMRWDLVSADNPELVWIKQLIALRKENRALRIGNFRLIEAERILAFERYTERALETVVVLVNPSDAPVTERIMVANANLMDTTPMVHLLSPTEAAAGMAIEAAFMTVSLPPKTVYVLKPCEEPLGGYSRYKRVK
jgi:glycosidase